MQKMKKVIFMISVDVIKYSEAHLTSKNRSSKNLLSCLEALYMKINVAQTNFLIKKLCKLFISFNYLQALGN